MLQFWALSGIISVGIIRSNLSAFLVLNLRLMLLLFKVKELFYPMIGQTKFEMPTSRVKINPLQVLLKTVIEVSCRGETCRECIINRLLVITFL